MPDSAHDERFLRTSVMVVEGAAGEALAGAFLQLEKFKDQSALITLCAPPSFRVIEHGLSQHVVTLGLTQLPADVEGVQDVISRLHEYIDDWQPKFILSNGAEPYVRFAVQASILLRGAQGAVPPGLFEFGTGEGRKQTLDVDQLDRKRLVVGATETPDDEWLEVTTVFEGSLQNLAIDETLTTVASWVAGRL